MKPRNIKTRCVKRKTNKNAEVIRLYDNVMIAFADSLEKDDNVIAYDCNVIIDEYEDGKFTTDFLIIYKNGDSGVRECVTRKQLLLPRTAKLLDASRNYWESRGITDWAVVVEKEDSADGKETDSLQ